MATRYLYLVRHGQYDPHAPAPDALEGGLTPLGKKQAEKTAKALAKLPISTIHHSSLRRTTETAAPIIAAFPAITPQPARRLWECVPFVDASLIEIFEEVPKVQIIKEGQQAAAAFAHYFKPTRGEDKHEVIVSHANLIRYFVCRVLDVNPAAWLNMEARNCGITRVKVESNGFCVLISYNDLGHLPPNLHTDNLHT